MGLPLSSARRVAEDRTADSSRRVHDLPSPQGTTAAKPAGHRFCPGSIPRACARMIASVQPSAQPARRRSALAVLLRRGAYCLPMPKSRGRKPKKNRAPANSAKAIRCIEHHAARVSAIDTATPRTTLTKNRTNREACVDQTGDLNRAFPANPCLDYCRPCGHRNQSVCLCI
jgi:hypothetical protein